MKTNLIIAAGVIVAMAASFSVASAQQFGDTPVKILPTAQKGILKVMYASASDSPVLVRFFDDQQLIIADKINGSDYPNGFSKKYDCRKVKAENFTVEVSSSNLTVTYRLLPSRDGQTFEPLLEKTTISHSLTASKK